MFLFDVHTSTM